MSEHDLLYRFRISDDAASALDRLPACIEEANPLPERRRNDLRYEIRDLWRSLTMERAHRGADYLSNPAFFSAYLRYFLPWNLIRLIAMLTDLPLELAPDSRIIDIGSGPLTFILALYCARPALRKTPLTIVCMDRAPRIMEAGKLILETLAARHAGELPPWKILLRRARFGDPVPEKADLLCAANVFNEFFWRHEGTLAEDAAELYHRASQYCVAGGSMLIVEPGEPRSGSLMSAMRAAAILNGDAVRAPCPHANACPMPGIFRSGQEYMSGSDRHPPFNRHHESAPAAHDLSRTSLAPVRMPSVRTKYPWCHFSLPASFAPRWLVRLSEEAGLAKEKLSFSFLYAEKKKVRPKSGAGAGHRREPLSSGPHGLPCRVVSDIITLPGEKSGRYTCSPRGYTLLAARAPENLPESGSLVEVQQRDMEHPEFDQKSGAILISY